MDKVKNFIGKLQDVTAKVLLTRPLAVFSVLAFIFVIMRLYFPIEPLLLLAFFIGCVFIFLYVQGKTDAFITGFLCVSMLLGICAANNKLFKVEQLYKSLDDEYVRISGTVSSVPDEGKSFNTFFVECDEIESHKGTFNNVKVYVKLKDRFPLSYGDRILFNAKLTAAGRNNTPFEKYYLAKGALFTASDVTVLGRSPSTGFDGILARARNYFISVSDKWLENHDARALFKALTAGDRSDFSKELTRNLSLSGLSHIACVSGLHVSIIGMAVFSLFKKRGRVLSAIVALLAVYFFAFLTGATPSSLRAAIMFTSFIIARIALRDNDSFTSLCFSAMLLILINPYVIFDTGFILSFLSVLGIQIFSYYFKQLMSFLPDKLSDSISVTMAAQLMTAPVIVNMFGYLTTYSVFSNIIISVIFIWVLYLCFVLAFVAPIPIINTIMAWLCECGLIIIAAVANFFAELPFSHLGASSMNEVQITAYYVIVVMFVFREKLSKWFTGTVLLLCMLLSVISAFI